MHSNEGLRDQSSSVDHWSKGRLNNKNLRGHSSNTAHQSRGLDIGLRAYWGQMDHQSSRQDENPGDQHGQVDSRSTGPDKGSKYYSGMSAHRSTRLDHCSREHYGPKDHLDNSKLNSKFSSHRCLNREISIESQASDQNCDNRQGLLTRKKQTFELKFFQFLISTDFDQPFLHHFQIFVHRCIQSRISKCQCVQSSRVLQNLLFEVGSCSVVQDILQFYADVEITFFSK